MSFTPEAIRVPRPPRADFGAGRLCLRSSAQRPGSTRSGLVADDLPAVAAHSNYVPVGGVARESVVVPSWPPAPSAREQERQDGGQSKKSGSRHGSLAGGNLVVSARAPIAAERVRDDDRKRTCDALAVGVLLLSKSDYLGNEARFGIQAPNRSVESAAVRAPLVRLDELAVSKSLAFTTRLVANDLVRKLAARAVSALVVADDVRAHAIGLRIARERVFIFASTADKPNRQQCRN